MKKPFIITIDTEGDSLWDNPKVIETRNARNLPRFQALCDKYGFKPVYLTDYEMICDNWYVDFASGVATEGRCEIGLHIHAWNSPPFESTLPYGDSQPFLSEFPPCEIQGKVRYLKQLIEQKTGVSVVSHRAGRWGLSPEYAAVLSKEGIKVDCSATPFVNWSRTKGYQVGGPDFSRVRNSSYYICTEDMMADDVEPLLEVPVTIVPASRLTGRVRGEKSPISSLQGFVGRLLNRKIWLRPGINNLGSMLALVEHSRGEDYSYLEFILHSSEFSAGLNPTFITEKHIDELYQAMDELFANISNDYYGCTLAEYEERVRSERSLG